MRRSAKYLVIGVFSLVLFTVVGLLAWWWVHGYSRSAQGAAVVYGDLQRFEAAVGQLPADRSRWPAHLQESYLATGSKGLRAYAATYGLTSEQLTKMVAQDAEAWSGCRLMQGASALEPAIRKGLQSFDELYRGAVFPPVYFIVGGQRAGGMNAAAGVVISAELYRNDFPGCPAESRLTRPSTEIPCLVVHELAHFNHAKNTPFSYFRRWSNLERAIKEGVADFMAERAAGCHVSPEAHKYGVLHEVQLWEEFQQVADSNDTGEWFWVEPKDGRPADLGYFVGYRIVRSYYERAANKEEAIRDMLNVSDYRHFLQVSGYSGGK